MCILKPVALALFALCLTADSCQAQQTTAPVVARFEMQLQLDDETIDVIEKGDLLTVLKEEEDTLLIQTHSGQQAMVDKVSVARLEEAVEIYDELIEKFPKEGRYCTLRASAWLARGDQIAALNDYDQAIENGYREADAYVSRGMFHASVGNYDAAIDDYTEAIALDSDNSSSFISRAAVYVIQQEIEKAIRDYSAALNLQPRTTTYQQRAIAWRRLGEPAKAISDYSASLDINPNHIPSLTGRGFLYFQTGDSKAAIEDFSAVISINPKAAEAWNNRGYNRQLLGEYQDALRDYRQATKLAPGYALAWTNTAWLLSTCSNESVRDGEKAIEAATTACELTDYQDFNCLKALAAAFAEDGDFEKAVGWQEKSIERCPEDRKEDEKTLLKRYQQEKPFRVVRESADADSNEDTDDAEVALE